MFDNFNASKQIKTSQNIVKILSSMVIDKLNI